MNFDNDNLQSKEKNAHYVWLVLSGLVLLPYFIFCFYTHPIGDDFVNSSSVMRVGVIQTCVDLFYGWSGRYSSNLLLSLNPIVFGSYFGYQLSIALIFLHFIVSFYWLLNLITSSTNRLFSASLSIIMVLVYLTVLPTISEGIYWFGASVTYQLANNLFLNYLCLIILWHKSSPASLNSKILTILLLTLGIAIIGFNEISLVYLMLFNVGYFGSRIIQKKQTYSSTLILLLVSAGALVAIFAPGNSVRSLEFESNHDFLYSVGMSIAQTGRFSLKWIFSPSLILLSLLFIAYYDNLVSRIPILKKASTLNYKWTIPLLFLPIFIASVLPYWSTGILGQHRTMISAWLVFLFLYFINLSAIYQLVINRIQGNLNWLRMHKNKIAVLLFLSFMITGNGFNLYSDLLQYKHIEYDLEMKSRENELLVDKPTYYFRQIQNPSKTLLIFELSPKSDNYINRSYGYYFNRKDSQIIGVTN